MSNIWYSSLTGMLAAGYGLQNTSNNVANMQSPGFKRNDVFYSSLGQHHGQDNQGIGVCISGQNTNFSAGNYLETGNATDMAIVGNGFFIVRLPNNELMYTRDGEFGFNNDGFLIDKHSGGLIQAYGLHGELVPISEKGERLSAGKATRNLDLTGEFIIIKTENENDPLPTKSHYEPIKFEINIFDKHGKSHSISLEFEAPHSPGNQTSTNEYLKWDLISAHCKDAEITFSPQSIEFDSDYNGSIRNGSNSISITLNDDQKINLNFGEFMSDSSTSVRLYKKDQTTHVDTHLEIKKQDGFALGKQTGFSFDDNGLITYRYNNGQTSTGLKIALARFDDMEHVLMPAHDNLFRVKHLRNCHIGCANEPGFGALQPKKLESANVDSTTEFAHIVVLQRMFQACSQIMDIDKQLLEDLSKK